MRECYSLRQEYPLQGSDLLLRESLSLGVVPCLVGGGSRMVLTVSEDLDARRQTAAIFLWRRQALSLALALVWTAIVGRPHKQSQNVALRERG